MTGVTLRDFTVDPSFDVDQVEGAVRKYGAAVLPGWADRPMLDALRAEFEQVLNDKDDSYAYQINYAPGRACSIMRDKMPDGRYPALRGFFEHPKMKALAQSYIGHPCLLNYEVYATHESKPAVSVAPAHFDKLWTLKYMLYLKEVGPDDAPFGIIPGSLTVARQRFRAIFDTHQLDYLAMNDERYQNMNNSELPAGFGGVVDITGPAGTLIVFDTDTFHHAGTVSPGHERMILRGHSGPSVTYARVRKGSRQWWRGERAFSRIDAWKDRLAEKFTAAS
jgi:hypothetical protein